MHISLEKDFFDWDEVNFLVLFDWAEVSRWECHRIRVMPQLSFTIGNTCFVYDPTMLGRDAEELDFVIRIIGFCEFFPVHDSAKCFGKIPVLIIAPTVYDASGYEPYQNSRYDNR
ncbi:hypothetical protein [uncultured Duncaniella sp.]|uniref:hypothetical protein n=1 Tax=uncultured Duncaniella sp. TaxID=2768039 RepID=UPI002649B8A1|nr:hypothetical protein [uncultured Duncaniella sp.]